MLCGSERLQSFPTCNLRGTWEIKNKTMVYYWPERKNQRLKNYDYSQSGYYFVTFCTKGRIDYFGEIIDGKIILNDYGKIVRESFFKTQEIRNEIMFDEYIIMPNHIHAIIIIQNPVGNAGMRSDIADIAESMDTHSESGPHACGPYEQNPYKWNLYENTIINKTKNILSNTIQWIKSSTTRNIRQNFWDYEFAWQKSFFDVIIKNQEQLEKTREYIIMNPLKWEEDINNPINISQK